MCHSFCNFPLRKLNVFSTSNTPTSPTNYMEEFFKRRSIPFEKGILLPSDGQQSCILCSEPFDLQPLLVRVCRIYVENCNASTLYSLQIFYGSLYCLQIVVCMWTSSLKVYPKSLKFTAQNRPFRKLHTQSINQPG